jgi:hypothetical protein
MNKNKDTEHHMSTRVKIKQDIYDCSVDTDIYSCKIEADIYTCKIEPLIEKEGTEYYGFDSSYYGYDDEQYGYYTGEKEYE